MSLIGRTRETQQRRIIYETLRKTHRHPTAEWVFERVRTQMPKISLGTIYRNLSVLHNEGLVLEIHGTDRKTRFDARTEPHAHFICTICNEVRDVEDVGELPWKTLKDLVGCEILEQRIEFFGLCPTCRRKRRA